MKKFFLILSLLILCNYIFAFTVIINVDQQPTCEMCDGVLSSTVSGGTSPYTYYWDGPNGFTSTTSNFLNACAGAYSLTVTDAHGTTTTTSTILVGGTNFPFHFYNTSGNFSNHNEEIYDIATDDDGSIYMIGTFTDNITIGNNTYTNTLGYDYSIFIAKFDYCGYCFNSRVVGGVKSGLSKYDFHIELACNYQNNLYVAGEFTQVDFTTTNNPMYAQNNGIDIFIALLDRNTLATVNNSDQNRIYSSTNDMVKGFSVANGQHVTIAGTFQGKLQSTFAGWHELYSNGLGTDLFIANFVLTNNCHSLTLHWNNNSYSGMFSDYGMSLIQLGSGNVFFTYQKGLGTGMASYIVVLHPAGTFLAQAQIGTGNDYYYINDMAWGAFNGSLYIAGYKSIGQYKQAAIIRYPSSQYIPWGININWPPAGINLADSPNHYTEVTSISEYHSGQSVTDELYFCGNYDYNNFRFIDNYYNLSQPIYYVYNTTNHFIYKTNMSLDPTFNNGRWLTGAMTGTTGMSRVNKLKFDPIFGVYYVGGTFSNQLDLNLNLASQTINSYCGNDAFVGRFVDNYWRAEFKSLKFNNNTDLNSDISVFPSPASNFTTIYAKNNETIYQISISDVTGKELLKNIYKNNETSVNIDTHNLSSGTYIVLIVTNNNYYNKKLVINK